MVKKQSSSPFKAIFTRLCAALACFLVVGGASTECMLTWSDNTWLIQWPQKCRQSDFLMRHYMCLSASRSCSASSDSSYSGLRQQAFTAVTSVERGVWEGKY